MFNRLMGKLKPSIKESLTPDEIAELLHTNPEIIKDFEDSYKKYILDSGDNDNNFFSMNSRQASKLNHTIEINEILSDTNETPNTGETDLTLSISELEDKIVNELLAETVVYEYENGKSSIIEPKPLLNNHEAVSNEEIKQLPEYLRPQLTGNLMKVDISEPSYKTLLFLYDEYLKSKKQDKRKQLYHQFRQGLDILDLDRITYKIISTNPNSMGFWFPKLVEACKTQSWFKLPTTRIANVPLTLLQLTRQEYSRLTPTTLKIVDKWAQEAFKLDENQEYFIKTGTYSSKFDFRNAYVHGAKEVQELGEYLLFIHFQALQMASPLCNPCIYGVSTTTEWVVREFIHDKENNPCIYKGLPLHTEYRVFVDCDTDKVIGLAPYWEPETMKNRFSSGNDANSPHQIHDYIIYKAHEETLIQRYYDNKNKVVENIEKLLPYLDLPGQWSIDIMQNGEDFWIIDMALAEQSAFYNCVPEGLRNPSPENWLPEIKD